MCILPSHNMHAVHKKDSTTSKLRIVFDGSASTALSPSLNNHLLVEPSVHTPLIDVLLRFMKYKVSLTNDEPHHKDPDRFVWSEDPK